MVLLAVAKMIAMLLALMLAVLVVVVLVAVVALWGTRLARAIPLMTKMAPLPNPQVAKSAAIQADPLVNLQILDLQIQYLESVRQADASDRLKRIRRLVILARQTSRAVKSLLRSNRLTARWRDLTALVNPNPPGVDSIMELGAMLLMYQNLETQSQGG